VQSLAIKARRLLDHDGIWKAWVQGTSEILPDGDGHMEPDASPSPSSDGQKLAKESSQLWRATQAFGCATPSLLLPAPSSSTLTSGMLGLTSQPRLLSVVRG